MQISRTVNQASFVMVMGVGHTNLSIISLTIVVVAITIAIVVVLIIVLIVTIIVVFHIFHLLSIKISAEWHIFIRQEYFCVTYMQYFAQIREVWYILPNCSGKAILTYIIINPYSMARVSLYLNFPRSTEEAFNFYKSVFGTEFNGPIHRMGEVPADPSRPALAEEDKNLVMHVELPLLGGMVLMGTDAPESMGFTVKYGNNIFINLEPDTRAETKRLFDALSAGGKVDMELQEMFWGDYFGSCTDKYGVAWMFNCSSKE